MRNLNNFQRFEIKFVESGRFLEEAQVLRHKTFFKKAGRDRDAFDRFCKHIVVIERCSEKVVGTYRLLLGSIAEKNGGFYSEAEFDLSNIKRNCRGQLLELGRACVDESYRRYPIINLLWEAIISYIEKNGVRYIFGCASIDEPSPQKIGSILRFFKDKFYSPPSFRVSPWEKKRYLYKEVEEFNGRKILGSLPSLIRGYLKMGAFVCGEPARDELFNTADFFMMLDTRRMNISYKKRFL